jgi:hypothetical protein
MNSMLQLVEDGNFESILEMIDWTWIETLTLHENCYNVMTTVGSSPKVGDTIGS